MIRRARPLLMRLSPRHLTRLFTTGSPFFLSSLGIYRQKPRHSLIWKISLFLLAGISLIFALLSVADYTWQRRAFLNTVNAHIAGEARLLVALVSTATSADDFEHILASLAPSLGATGSFTQDHQVFLVDEKGNIHLASTPEKIGQSLWNQELESVLHNPEQKRFGVMNIDGRDVYYGAFPVTMPDGASWTVVIAKPYEELLGQMRLFLIQRILLLTLLTSTLLIAALAVTHYLVLSPLRRLLQTMERVSQGDLNTRVEIRRNDELGMVGTAFNHMLTALQQAQRRSEEERRRLALLYDINRQLISVSDWDTLVDLVLHLPKRIMPVEAAIFVTYHEPTHRFTLEGAWGLAPSTLATLESHLARTENPSCLTCPSCLAHTEAQCPLLVPGLLRNTQEYMLCLRLAHGRNTVGFLYLRLSGEVPLTPERLQLLNAVGGELAVAIAAAQSRAREIHLLAELKAAHRSPAHLMQTLQFILERTLEVGQAQRGVIFLSSEDGKELLPAAWHQVPQEHMETWRALALQGLEQEDPMIITRRFVSDTPTEHVAVVPLRAGEETLGVLVLATQRATPYSRHTLTFLAAIGAQLALTIQTARLYARLEQQAVLQERTRLAREIHDVLAQSLAYMRWKMYQMDRWIQEGNQERLLQEVNILRQVVEESYQEVREAIEGLRLPLDEKRSFTEALEEYARRFALRTGIAVDMDLQPIVLPFPTRIQLLRVVQEALANVRKHAQATRVTLTLTHETLGIRLGIRDNGVGFDLERVQRQRRFGLYTMEERVRSLGGDFRIYSEPGEGTLVEVFLPYARIQAQEDIHARHSGLGGG